MDAVDVVAVSFFFRSLPPFSLLVSLIVIAFAVALVDLNVV